MSDTQITPITFNVKMQNPALITPKPTQDGSDKFFVVFTPTPQQLEQLSAHDVLANPRSGLITASSLFAPLLSVEDGDYNTFLDAMELAQARNLRDAKLFDGMQAEVSCLLTSYTSLGLGRRMNALRLEAVTLPNAGELYDRARSITLNRL